MSSYPTNHATTILVTGASSGIGEACALHFDAMGMRVFAGVRRESDGAALRRKASPRLTPLQLDVTVAEEIARAAEVVSREVGAAGLDGLVNNAGVASGAPVEFIDLHELRQLLEVNLVGQVAVTQAFLPLLRQARGRIVNVSSVSGRVAMPFFGAYSASKFALEAISDALRVELRPWGVAVSLVEPGSIATPIWEKSLAQADERLRRMPPEAHRLFGRQLPLIRRMAEEMGQAGLPAERVARVVAHALTSPRPKVRYVVPRRRAALIALALLLPVRWRDWIVARKAGLA